MIIIDFFDLVFIGILALVIAVVLLVALAGYCLNKLERLLKWLKGTIK